MPTVKEGFVQEIIGRYDGDQGMLIPMMQDMQAEYGYLPPEELARLAKELGVPLTRVYGVAMFYSSFRLVPKGRHEVTLCMGTVCYLKGAPRISEAICAEYGIQPGGTTSDRLFTLQAVNCVGACALAPVMIVDGKYYDGVTPDKALDVLRGLAAKAEEPEAAEPARPAPAAAQGDSAGPAAEPARPAPAAAQGDTVGPAAEARAVSSAPAAAQSETAVPAGEPADLAAGVSPAAVVVPDAAFTEPAAAALVPDVKAKPPARAASAPKPAKAKAAKADKPAVVVRKKKSAPAGLAAPPAKQSGPAAAPKRGTGGVKKGGRK